MAHLIEELGVGNTALTVKFMKTVRVASITDDRFVLQMNAASPITILDPFKSIQVSNDYNTVSRTLTLYFDSPLQANTDYILTATGLQDAIGNTIANESVAFTTAASVTPTPTDPVWPSDGEGGTGGSGTDAEIIDYSISGTDLFDSSLASEFRIAGTDPPLDDPIVTPTYANGRVTLQFSAPVSAAYVNSTYIKAQKKVLQRGYARWESVPVQISTDTVRPWVYVDFPSTDSSPVYATAGHEYFPEDYKFRVRVSKDVEPAPTVDAGGSTVGRLDLVIDKGATFDRTLSYQNPDGSPKDLTGYTALMQVRTTYGGTLIIELGTANGRVTIEPLLGQITMHLSAVETDALPAGDAVYDLELTSSDATPVVIRLVEGKVTVREGVTT